MSFSGDAWPREDGVDGLWSDSLARSPSELTAPVYQRVVDQEGLTTTSMNEEPGQGIQQL